MCTFSSTGLGYGMAIVSGIVCIYYNVIITWALYYMYLSVKQSVVPWATCGNWWNTDQCSVTGFHNDSKDYSEMNSAELEYNETNITTNTSKVNVPSQEFWT